jgi:P2 family phage contractile tail tube protein
MGSARKIKNINSYIDGDSFLGAIAEFDEPKLAIATDDWRPGGSIGAVKVDKGVEAMEAGITMGGHEARLFRKFGTSKVDGVRIRLVGAYQADDGSSPEAVEVFIGGRFSEIDPGTSKAGGDTAHKYKVPLVYYRRVVNGVDEIEIDMLAGTFIVGGVDRYAEIMAIITS